MNNILNNKVFIFIFITISLLFLLITLDKNKMQSADCTSAYLSGGANLTLNSGWRINSNEITNFVKLSNKDKLKYRFHKSEITKPYIFNAIGFVYIDYLARNIFFWQGDLEAIKSFQILIHIILSLYILTLFSKIYQKVLFLALYVFNPIILYFVNFPYYYFWQVVVTAIFLIYLLKNKRIRYWIFLLSIIFAFIFIIRPSTLFISIFILVVIGYKEKSILNTILAIFLMLGTGFLLKGETHNRPWHTMYIGVGAYPNSYGIELVDNYGYKKFEKETGTVTLGGCKRNDNYIKYLDFIKDKYFEIIKKSPSLIIKNAILNILESYGLGYKANYLYINYFSAFIGFILIVLLLYFKEYILFLAIGIASISFTPYYPPLGAYMYGSYILIIYAWIVLVGKILETRLKNE